MDLSIKYLGKDFDSPFVLASGPPTANAGMIKRAFEAGWAGAVVKTLIREPVKNLQNRFASIRSGNTIYAFENIELLSEMSPEDWYRDISSLKKDFPGKVVIGSIMGDAKDRDQWTELALGCQEAGADMIELNFSCPHGYPEGGKGAAIGQNPEYSGLITGWLKSDKRIKVPIIPKLTAAVTDISHIGEAVAEAGADGICAINTIPSIMGFDLKTLTPKPNVAGCTTPGGYSGQGIKPIALRCVSDLVGSVKLPVMGGGGISTGYDSAEFLLAGAPVLQICTAVMLEGYSIISRMKEELAEFMSWHNFASIYDFLGTGRKSIKQFSELDQDYSVKASIDPAKCCACGKCHISCRDAATAAIDLIDKSYIVDRNKCCGCSLCSQICSFGAITLN